MRRFRVRDYHAEHVREPKSVLVIVRCVTVAQP
jgi:hypothetical protein